jgi:uncharacterized membrane protein
MTPLLFIGAAIGGAAMYFFDPDRGRRRRALVRDQAVRARSNVRDFVDAGTRDLKNRGSVVLGRTRSLVKRGKPTDAVLVERVRSRMGRYVAHPGAIEVTALDGEVTLKGSILAHEHRDLIDAIQDVAGVKHLRDEISVYETAQGISELQGEPRRRSQGAEFMDENWAPGPRLLAGAGAMTLAAYGMRWHGFMRLVTFAAGVALLLRTATNKPLRTLAGKGGAKGIDIQKTVHINAPVHEVYQFLSNYENFPKFMRNIRSVQVHADGRSHWIVAGPLGSSVEWDSLTTRTEPDRLIEWSTIVGSPVEHAGTIRLASDGEDSTRVHIHMSYNPPAGAVGHVVAKLFGADPKSEMDEDLMRLKSTLESGRPTRNASAQWQDQNQGESSPV